MNLAENVVVAGKFRLLRMLGRGGMGSVWEAKHLALDIPCAVKFIEGDFANVPEMQARFHREAKAAAALRSPNVVQILDHDVWEGMPYIAMELLDGEELSKRLARAGTLTLAETNAVLGQVCRALAKAHAQGIVHRDLKPDNLFLVRDDDREIVKILDFGIAKSTNPSLDIGGGTKTGAMLGTPFYMSPEQAQGNKAIDGRADLWALGVIAYECATGRRPFESDALGDLLMQIMVKPLPVPSEARPGLPAAFDAWFAKACARDPSGRFQSAKELADGLASVAGQASTTDAGSSAARPVVSAATVPLNTPSPYGATTPNPEAPPAAATGPGGPAPFVASVAVPPKRSNVGVVAAVFGGLTVLGLLAAFALHSGGRHGGSSAAAATLTPAASTAVAKEVVTTAAATATATAAVAPEPSATAVSARPGTHAKEKARVRPGSKGKAPHAAPSGHAASSAGAGAGADLGF